MIFLLYRREDFSSIFVIYVINEVFDIFVMGKIIKLMSSEVSNTLRRYLCEIYRNKQEWLKIITAQYVKYYMKKKQCFRHFYYKFFNDSIFVLTVYENASFMLIISIGFTVFTDSLNL